MGKGVIKETKSELKKVIWPGPKDVTVGTASVVVISGLIGLFIVLADMASYKIVELVTNGITSLIG